MAVQILMLALWLALVTYGLTSVIPRENLSHSTSRAECQCNGGQPRGSIVTQWDPWP
jgi:hypothetical protein